MYFPKEDRHADHIEAGRPAVPWHALSSKTLSSQTPRAPMLLFEFEGELFQFEAREPQLTPLSQLPPKIAALLSCLPLAFLRGNPLSEHFPDFGDHDLRHFYLM